jgi:hypothetical protein
VSAATVRRAVEEAGVVLRRSRGDLVMKAPTGMLTPDLIAALREHKAELLDLLDAEKAADVRRRAENAFSPDALADEAELCIRGELT